MASNAKRISVSVTADPSDAIAGFRAVSEAANAAAEEATAAGDRVAAAAVRQADTAAQAAARAAQTAAAESKAAADAFEEGDTAAYERAAAAADAAAKKAEAAWAKADAAAVKAAQEAAAAEGTASEEAAAKAAAAAKESAAQARMQWDAAKTASHDAATVAEEDAARFGSAFEGAATKTGGLFQKLGQSLGNFGLPFSESIAKIGEKFAEAETGGQKFGAALAEVGKVATVAGAAGFAVIGAESIKMAGNFQQATERLVTGAGESEAAIGKVRNSILSLAGQVGYGPEELAHGMYLIESAGYHGAQGIDVLKAAAQGAKADGASLEATGNALTSVMTDLHAKGSDAATVMSQMVAAVGQGKMTMDDLAGSIHNVLPNAVKVGLSFSQVAGALATMTAQGMSADQASQDLNHTIVKLAAPTAAMTSAMASYGLNAQDVAASLGKNGLTGTLNELVDAITSHMGPGGLTLRSAFYQSQAAAQDLQRMLNTMPPSVRKVAEEFQSGSMTMSQFRKALPTNLMGMATQFASLYNKVHGFSDALKSGGQDSQTFTAALKAMVGDQTSMAVALHLTGESASTFSANVQKIAGATADAKGNVRDWSAVQNEFNQQLTEAKATVESLGIRLGMVLIPKLEAVMHAVAGVISWFSKHTAAAEVLAGVIGGVLAVAIGTFVTLTGVRMVKSVQEAMGALTNLGKKVVENAADFGRWAAQNASRIAQWVADTTKAIAEMTAKWAAYFAKWVAETAASTGKWLATQAVALKDAAVKVVEFIAAHAAATATFIAQNVAMAASATAAFIAENAATLGIIAALAALVGAVVYVATHWKQVWGDIKAIVMDAWHFLTGVFHDGIIGDLLSFAFPLLGLLTHWQTVWHGITAVVQTAWSILSGIFNSIKSAVSDIVGAVGKVTSVMSHIPGAGMISGAVSAIAGFLAGGGTAEAGKAYIVGEQGPELFVPDTSGMVIPNGLLSGSSWAPGSPLNIGTVASSFNPGQVRGMMQGLAAAGASSSTAGITYAPVLNITGVSDQTVANRIAAELEVHDRHLVALLHGM